MDRRTFIGSIAGGLVAVPLASRAQQPNKMRRVGVISGNAIGDAQAKLAQAVFTEALKELGWVEGRNIVIDYRWAAGDVEKMQVMAKELVNLRPDVIVGHTTPVVAALQRETQTVPIVFLAVSDPIGSGFVASLSRPGGNITGFINLESSLAGKWVEVLKQLAPRVTRAALIFNPQTAPYSNYYMLPFESAGRSHGIEAVAEPVRNPEEIAAVVKNLAKTSTGGLVVMPDISTTRFKDVVISLAAQYRVPAMYPYQYMASAGGLISYGIDIVDLWRRAPASVDRILKGAKPADLPVEQPTKFEMVINLKTAKALGLTIPQSLLVRADDVIQ
jgi:putative ABC transport system substrate-binding protein